MTHATRALQSHYLSGEWINFGSHTYFFVHTRTWRASPDQWSGQCSATSKTTRTSKTIHTVHSLSHSNMADMLRMVMTAKWYSGNHVGLKLPDFCLTGEENPRWKPHPGNLSRPWFEPGPAAWNARLLLPVPQRWTGNFKIQQNSVPVSLKENWYQKMEERSRR